MAVTHWRPASAGGPFQISLTGAEVNTAKVANVVLRTRDSQLMELHLDDSQLVVKNCHLHSGQNCNLALRSKPTICIPVKNFICIPSRNYHWHSSQKLRVSRGQT
jgi:hypothetical protein